MRMYIKGHTNQLLLSLLALFLSHTTHAGTFETSHWQTKNGAEVIFYQAMNVPMLDISVAFAAGSAYDGKTFGISTLTTHLLNQGSQGISTNAMAEALATTGAQFEAENNKDMVVLNLKTLTAPNNLKKANALFSSIINHPDFSKESFTHEKEQQLMLITQSQQSPEEIANQTFFRILYKQHPYAHPSIGYRETVNLLKLEQVQRFYHEFFVASNTIIVLVGAINQSTAEILAEELTKDLPNGHPAPTIPEAKPLTEEINVEVPFPSSQTMLRLGQLGIDHHNPNYFPLQVGNYILGAGALVSRLAQELREKRGLTYGVSSQFFSMPGKGPFLISFSTRHRQIQVAKTLTRETLASFIKTGPTEAELFAAKQYLTGNFPLLMSSNRSIANMLLKIAFYHLPNNYLQTYIDHINAVTSENIKIAFQQLITPNKLLEVAVGQS